MMHHAAWKAAPLLFVLSGLAFADEGAIRLGVDGGRLAVSAPGSAKTIIATRAAPLSNMPIIVPDSSIAYSLHMVQPPQDRHYMLKIVPAPLISDVARAARSK